MDVLLFQPQTSILSTINGAVFLVVVLLFTYFIIITRWVNKMVDVVTTRMMGTFNRFAPQDGQRKESLATISSLKRFSIEQRYKRSLTREAEFKAKESHLYEIKETTTPMIHPVKRPYTGLCCAGCTPSSRDSLVNKTTQSSPLINVLEQNFSPQQNSLFYRLFPHLAQCYSLKKYDFPQVAGLILKEPRLKNAIEMTALEHFEDVDTNDDEIYKQLLKTTENRAKRILKDMRSTLSDFLLRFTSWVLYKLLPCFLSSVVVHHGQVEMLKEASESGHPLIFLPLHKSHLDYILISFILLNNNIRSPLVAAGNNLRIPFFGSLLRGLGAFFIKRRIDPIMGRKDHVYKTLLHTYMNACLRAGHNIEFFLEGGRTRTGKPCMPKYGILSVILDAFMDGTIEDALLVPVSVNYEKLVDGNFVREQLGQPKEMETFGAAIKGIWHVLNSNYGMMRIDFHQPFSMRELVKTFDTTGKVHQVNGMTKKLKSNPSTTSLYGTDVVSDKHKPIVEKISKHVIYDCGNNTAVMSTNAVAFLLLNKFRKGTKIDDLVVALDDLRKELRNSNVEVGFSGDSLDVIHYAIELLGPAVIKREKLNNEEIIKPVSMLPNVIELAYYSNVVLPYYALESVIALALNSCCNPQFSYLFENDLVESSMDLCEILQFEFIFYKPCQSLDVCILDCVDDFVVKREIFQRDNINAQDLERGRRIAQELFDEDDMLEGEEAGERRQNMPKLLVNSEESAKGTLQFLRNLLLPLIEAYSVTAFCLEKLVGRSMLEGDLVKDVVKEMRRQVDCGVLKHEECVSSDSVKNAIKLFQKWEVLECHNEHKLRLYYLKDMYDNSESVTVIRERIDKYRFVNYAE